DLPWPVEKLALKLRSLDGKLKVEEATAKIGPAQVQLSLETRNLLAQRKPSAVKAPASADELDLLEEHLQKLEVVATGLPLDDALFARLGAKAARARTMFAPTGTIAIGYKFSHEAAGNRHEYEVRPHSVAVIYEKFKYPVTEVQGSLKKTVAPGEPAQISV